MGMGSVIAPLLFYEEEKEMLRKIQKRIDINKALTRFKRLLDTLQLQGVEKELQAEGVQVIICNDGVVLLNLEKGGFGVCLVKGVVKVDFSLGLTCEEIKQFNGGSGLRERYFPYREGTK